MANINVLFMNENKISNCGIFDWFNRNYKEFKDLNLFKDILKDYNISVEDLCSFKSVEVVYLVSLVYSENRLFPGELLTNKSSYWIDCFAFSDNITIVCRDGGCLDILMSKMNKYRKFRILNTGELVKSSSDLQREYIRSKMFM